MPRGRSRQSQSQSQSHSQSSSSPQVGGATYPVDPATRPGSSTQTIAPAGGMDAPTSTYGTPRA